MGALGVKEYRTDLSLETAPMPMHGQKEERVRVIYSLNLSPSD
jgi:hypothetical protein